MAAPTDPIVGIDLGTSNSAVSYADATGAVQVLADDANAKIHPSVVSFHPNGGVIVGAAAKQRKVIDPANTVFSVKRLIGRRFQSPEVQTAKGRMSYQIKEGGSHMPMIVTRAGEFAVPEISAIVLDHMKGIATARLGNDVHRAVVTVPASFNDAQRSATATAGAVAGLTIVRVLNEPTAAALAYGHTRGLKQMIAVYDFGGGTFDVTILRLTDQVYEVLGTAGDSFLGGDDLDERLVEQMAAKFLADNRIDLRTNEVAMMRLRAVAEQTKIELSRRSRAVVRIDEIAYGAKGAPLNLQIEISRDQFVQNVAPIIDRTFPVCDEALALAGLGVDAIDDVLMVGGTTKIPYVRDQVAKFFGKAPRADIPPEEAVSLGAGLQASSLERMLSRKSSAKISAQQPAIGFAAADEKTTTAGAPMGADIELGSPGAASPAEQRRTNPYGSTPRGVELGRPATGEYSVSRAGVRDDFSGDTNADTGVRGAGGRQPTQALGRIGARPATQPAVPAAPPGSKTMFGVAAGPALAAFDADGTATEPVEKPYEIEPSGLTLMPPGMQRQTAPAAVAPPPVRATQAVPVAPPPMPASGRTTSPRSPTARPPAPTASQRAVFPGDPIEDFSTTIEGDAERRGASIEPAGSVAPTTPGVIALGPLVANTPPVLQTAAPGAKTLAPQMYPTLMQPAAAAPVAAVAAVAAAAYGAAPNAPTMYNAPIPGFDIEPSSAASTAKGFAPPPMTQQRPVVPTVLDVTPRGLGIATVAGYCEELIRRNSQLPAEKVKMFTTSRDSQDVVRIVVCQGESRRLDANVVIGDLTLGNLPPRARGETTIEVTFRIDASGILKVRARDAKTGKEQQASLDTVGNLNEQEVAASKDRLQAMPRAR